MIDFLIDSRHFRFSFQTSQSIEKSTTAPAYFACGSVGFQKDPSLLFIGQSHLLLISHSSFIFLAQGSASVGKHTVCMSDNAEKAPDEKPSPEQCRKAATGKKAPLFTSETKTIIWGLQARAVQVYITIRISNVHLYLYTCYKTG